MSFLPPDEVGHLMSAYGYGAVGGIVALESMGVPLPGETALVAAALVAGTTHTLDIRLVIAIIAGAIFIRRHAAGLEARAEQALPGPVRRRHSRT